MASANSYKATITIAKRLPIEYKGVIGGYKAYRRSSISTKEDKASISISIAADDATALRASLNSIMRDIRIIESTGRLARWHQTDGSAAKRRQARRQRSSSII